jgi:hypothetical protein
MMKKGTDDYIISEKKEPITIMDSISKAFTHYRKGAELKKKRYKFKKSKKDLSTWVNQVMNQDTKLSSHSPDSVLKRFLFRSLKVLTAIEVANFEINIFG